jgi:hypothetical protein
MACKDLLDFAVKRWLQEWNMYPDADNDEFVACSFTSNQCDDVGIVTIDIVPTKL